MSRAVLGLLAVGAVVIAVAIGVAWRVKMQDQAAIGQAAAPPAPAPAPAPTSVAAPVPAATTSGQPPATPPAQVVTPSFDVAKIGKDGRAVVAGRAAPGAKVVLLDGGKEIASGVADARGEWVLLVQDPPLTPGQHELRIVQHVEGRAPVTSEQMIVAVVPEPTESGRDTLVVVAPREGPSTLLQAPSPAGVPKSNDLQLSTLDYDDRGFVTVTGQASAGAAIRAYIDNKPAAEGTTGADGRWRLAPTAPIAPGKHTLRLDRLGSDGKPAARLELTFERLASAVPAVADRRRLTVVRGDNLWNIARAHYGEGLRYTVIFDANKNQIRDPDLIYPGQIFSLPKLN